MNDSIIIFEGFKNGDPDTYFCVDKIMLFGILYTPSFIGKGQFSLIGGSKNSDYQGNLSKALLFYHLINGDNLI